MDLESIKLAQEFQEAINVKFTDRPYNADLYVYSIYTSDGYNIYVLSESDDLSNVDPENELFYYQPDTETIIDRISEVQGGYYDERITVFCDDFDEYFEEYVMAEFIENEKEKNEEL